MDRQLMADTIKANWWQIGLMVIGLALMVGGGVLLKLQSRGDQVVIISASPSPNTAQSQVVVDVAGAVEKPGVYRLPSGSRIGEVIIAAGGLSAKANRDFVAQSMNQAALVTDGMKIYIPDQNSQLPISNDQTVKQGVIVSVNTATEAELDTLWGIGSARAKTIIENRPYGSLDELITKAKITQEVLDKNQGKMGL